MNHPPYGLCLPIERTRVIDGDTVAVGFAGSDREWKIRLIDCWAPEQRSEAGKKATKGCQEFIDSADQLSVFIPAPKNVVNLLANLTFDRIPGHIFLREDLTLSHAMVTAGYATETKPK